MKKNYMAVAIAAMIFTSCSNAELEEPNPVIPEVAELGFGSVATADLETRAQEASKDWNNNFYINLTADAGASVYTAIEKETVTYNAGKYEIATPVYVTSTGRTLTAWAPDFTAESGSADLFTLTAGVYTEALDFISFKKDITSANCDKVAVEMKHAMTKITFKFVYPDNNTPKAIKNFVVSGLAASSKYDIAAGTWTGETAAQPINLIGGTAENLASNDQTKAILAIPTDDASALKIKLNVNGVDTAELPITALTKLVAGANYLVTISISDKTVGIESVKDFGWDNVDGGTVTI